MTEPTETCANCDRKIGRLEKSYAWQGHTVCLECYERLGRASGTGAQQPPVGTGEAPAATAAPTTDPEVTRWSASPSVIGYLPLYVVLCVVAAAALVGAYWQWQVALVAPIPLAGIGVQEIIRRSVRYSIIGQRLVLNSGILSRTHHEVRIPDIRELTNEQTFIGRILGIGTITVDTAAREGAEIRLENVPAPGEVVKTPELAEGLTAAAPPACGHLIPCSPVLSSRPTPPVPASCRRTRGTSGSPCP